MLPFLHFTDEGPEAQKDFCSQGCMAHERCGPPRALKFSLAPKPVGFPGCCLSPQVCLQALVLYYLGLQFPDTSDILQQ